MSIVYLLQNQHQHFLDKSGEWVTPENTKALYRTEFKDEAINRKVEFSVKNADLRLTVTQATVGNNGQLDIDLSNVSEHRNDKTDKVPVAQDSANEDLFASDAIDGAPEEAEVTADSVHASNV